MTIAKYKQRCNSINQTLYFRLSVCPSVKNVMYFLSTNQRTLFNCLSVQKQLIEKLRPTI